MKLRLFLTLSILLFTSHLAQSATITGKVTYKGEKPKLREIKMDADPICLTHHTGAVYPQTITLGPNNEIAYAFVYVAEGAPKGQPVPTEPIVLDQKGCAYHPPVFGAMVGQQVKILNPDGTLHNVHALTKINPEFNLAMPKFRTEVVKTFDKPEFMFQVKCDVHPWMVAYGAILDHPFFSTSNEAGVFEIKNLPPGTYVIEAWQQRLAPQRVNVTIADANETKEVNFTFSRPDGK